VPHALAARRARTLPRVKKSTRAKGTTAVLLRLGLGRLLAQPALADVEVLPSRAWETPKLSCFSAILAFVGISRGADASRAHEPIVPGEAR